VESELAILCQSCGLCCDGSLFGRVDLGPEEVESARRRRLRVIHGGRGFEQPCAALERPDAGREQRRCSIYDERPLSCRRFTCRLHERQRQHGGPIEEPLAVVRRVRHLVALLEASGLDPADLAGSDPVEPRAEPAVRAYRELTRILEDDFARA
jgi:Fe-S-cluster containining protein